MPPRKKPRLLAQGKPHARRKRAAVAGAARGRRPGCTYDPRNVFLNATEVIARYGWGKTKGCQNLKDRELVPPPVMTHPDRWHLDQHLAWGGKRIALAEAALEAVTAPDREPTAVTDLLPRPKRRSRSAWRPGISGDVALCTSHGVAWSPAVRSGARFRRSSRGCATD